VFVLEGMLNPDRQTTDALVVRHLTSSDAANWSDATIVAKVASGAGLVPVAAMYVDGRSVAMFNWANSLNVTSGLMVLLQSERGEWAAASATAGLVYGPASALNHPKWGCILTWMTPAQHEWMLSPLSGPYLMRGALDPLLRPGEPAASAPTSSPSR
jgi:hypothetical protein